MQWQCYTINCPSLSYPVARQAPYTLKKSRKVSCRKRELLSFLHAAIREDHEEMRIRMAFVAKQYASVISDAKA